MRRQGYAYFSDHQMTTKSVDSDHSDKDNLMCRLSPSIHLEFVVKPYCGTDCITTDDQLIVSTLKECPCLSMKKISQKCIIDYRNRWRSHLVVAGSRSRHCVGVQ